MKKLAIITAVLGMFAFGIVIAATDDFTATSDITVTGVTLGAGTTDLTVKSGSKAESFGVSSGTFNLTSPDTTTGFVVTASNASVKALSLVSGATSVACTDNTVPGTTTFTTTQTAGAYTIVPLESICGGLCTPQPFVATYSGFPSCIPTSCISGYILAGFDCVAQGAGGGGGGSVSYVQTDKTAPTINDILFNEGAFTFKTNESSKTVVYWGLSTEALTNEQISNVYKMNHSFNLVDLEPDTIYYYKIKATDSASNSAEKIGTFEKKSDGTVVKTVETVVTEVITPPTTPSTPTVQALPVITAQDLIPTKSLNQMTQSELLQYLLKVIIFSIQQGRI